MSKTKLGGTVSAAISANDADETQQQILACLKRIECMLKDEEDERLRAKRELRDRMNIYQGKEPETL
jgi:hypothetical protein